MPLRRNTSSRSYRSAPRRKLVWARQTQTPSLTLAANTQVIIPLLAQFESVLSADLIGVTVRRIRGNITMRAGTAGLSLRVTAGIGVFPQAVTTVAVNPNLMPHLDWMYWRQTFAEPVIATEFVTLNMVEIDVRSQRKVEELNETLMLVLANTHPTDGLSYSFATSTLLALP